MIKALVQLLSIVEATDFLGSSDDKMKESEEEEEQHFQSTTTAYMDLLDVKHLLINHSNKCK
jgi:hypothetical protein